MISLEVRISTVCTEQIVVQTTYFCSYEVPGIAIASLSCSTIYIPEEMRARNCSGDSFSFLRNIL